MRRPVPFLVAAVVGAAACPAAAPAAPTSWAGWSSVGPRPKVQAATSLAAAGDVLVVLGDDANRNDGLLRFAVRSPAGDRSGLVPPARTASGREMTDDSRGVRAALHLPGPRRLLVATRCTVRTSFDDGARWTSATLPGCRVPVQDLPPMSFAFADPDHGVALAGASTWATTDGGRTWRTAAGDAGGDALGIAPVGPSGASAAGPASYVRVQRSPSAEGAPGGAPGGSFSVERSDDAGATWTTVPLPLPSLEPGAAPRPPGTPATVPALPAPLSAPVRRADGTIVVGGPGEVLLSSDGARTFSAVDVPPPPPRYTEPTAAPRSVTVGPAVCDPASRCVLPRSAGNVPYFAGVRLDGATVGADVAPPPLGAVAPQPGRILGLGTNGITGGVPSGPVVGSTDGGATYAVEQSGGFGGNAQASLIGDRTVLAAFEGATLAVSLDRGGRFRTIANPALNADGLRPAGLLTSTPGGLVALGGDGRLRRRTADGRWTDLADVRSVGPSALTSSGEVVLVAGATGLARVTPDGTVLRTPIRPAAPGEAGTPDVQARGSTALARAGSLTLRSTDGGRTWRRATALGRFDDVSLVSPRVVLGLRDGRALFRSTDAGRTFSRLSTVPPIRPLYRLEGTLPNIGVTYPSLDFATARRGVVTTDDGVFHTTDGGRTFVPVPVPTNQPPTAGLAAGRRDGGVIVVDGGSGNLLRSAAPRGRAPTIALRRVGAPRRSGSRRSQRVAGRLSRGPGDAWVQLLARGPSGDRQASFAVQPGRGGRFSATVRLRRGERSVRAVFGGLVLPERTWQPGTSRSVRVPAVRGRTRR